MAKKLITAKRFQKVVKDTLANLTAANRVYPVGYIIVETNPSTTVDDLCKVADGTTPYNELDYGIFPLIDIYTLLNDEEFEIVDNKISLQEEDSNFIHWFRELGGDIGGESLLTRLPDCSASTMGSGNTRGTWVKVKKDRTITELMYYQRVQGDYTAATTNETNGMALYKYNKTTGIASRVAMTANLPNLWKTAPGLVRVALTTPYAATAGLYLIAFRYQNSAQVTAPSMLARTVDGSAVATVEGLKFNFTDTVSFPATIDMNTASVTSVIYWLGFN